MGKEHELLDAARSGNIVQVSKILGHMSKRNIGPLSSFRRSPRVNHQDVNGYTPLHHACLNGHLEIVRLLLENDSSPDVRDVRGSTPLYLAAWAGHCEIVKMLLNCARKPVNVNVQTSENETALHCAAQHGHNAVLGTLLAYGANPAIRNNSFQTALDLAAQFGRLQVVQKLIATHPELLDEYRDWELSTNDLSCSVYINDDEGSSCPTKHIFTHTCLHLASRNGHKRVVETLLGAGVNVNIMTHAGTALHEAALCGKQSVVGILLQAGVNVHAVDGNGHTALDLLKEYPPHVTYGIVSMIKAVIVGHHYNDNNGTFRGTRSTSNSTIVTDDDMGVGVHDGDDDDDDDGYADYDEPRGKAHTMPNMPNDRSFYRRKKKPTSAIRFNGIKTLEANDHSPADMAKKNSAGLYLKMRPVLTSDSDHSDDNKPPLRSIKPDLVNNIYSNNTPKSTNSRKAYEQMYLARTGSGSNNAKRFVAASLANPNYNATDEYVKMTPPDANKLPLSKSMDHGGKIMNKPKPPMPSPRILADDKDYNDYANVGEKSSANHDAVDTHNLNNTDVNNNHSNYDSAHSPTPEFPPPTVTEAEHTILEYIQPTAANAHNKSKRSSLRLSEGDEKYLNVYLAQASPAESRQSNFSDHVEEFVDANPFAGLFKGSTLNLASEDKETARLSMRLRSPSLVRSIVPAVQKRQLAQESAHLEKEEFDEVQVWEEINSILESIGNDFATQPQTTMTAKEVETTRDESNLYIRKPSDIQLRTSKSGMAPNWCHAPNTLIYGQILYKVFYLGSTVVKELHGTLSTRKSIQKLKLNQCVSLEEELNANLVKDCNKLTRILKENNQQKRLEVQIAISCSGVRFIDVENNATISIHDIENINCVCQDVENMRYFAYITMEKGINYCHVFMVDNSELATEIILSLGQAFEVAYQLAISQSGNT